MKEHGEDIVFCEITREGDHYFGRCLEADVFTEGKTREEAMENLEEAVTLHFQHERAPKGISEPIGRKMNRGLTFAIHVPNHSPT